jgi:polyisoprenoid-binding protein YceI
MSATATRHSALRWIVTAVVVVAVLAVGGPFVYIHFIEGTAPAKFTLSASESSGAPAVPLDGTWSVAPGSQAGYRVQETLVGQHTTAVGRTSDVSGSMVIKDAKVESGSFTVDMSSVHSDQPTRDRIFHGRILNTSQFPTSTFTLTKPIDLGTPPASGATRSYTAAGTLQLHGVTKPISIPITATHDGSTIKVLGSTVLNFADYDIANPSNSVASTADQGTLEFLLIFNRGAATTSTTVAPTTTQPAPGGPGGFTPPTVPPETVPPLHY